MAELDRAGGLVQGPVGIVAQPFHLLLAQHVVVKGQLPERPVQPHMHGIVERRGHPEAVLQPEGQMLAQVRRVGEFSQQGGAEAARKAVIA